MKGTLGSPEPEGKEHTVDTRLGQATRALWQGGGPSDMERGPALFPRNYKAIAAEGAATTMARQNTGSR